jgi:hypothetical protein
MNISEKRELQGTFCWHLPVFKKKHNEITGCREEKTHLVLIQKQWFLRSGYSAIFIGYPVRRMKERIRTPGYFVELNPE